MNSCEPIPLRACPSDAETLLCVDDEANILSSLKRLFHPLGYRVLTATGGEQGLALLAENEVSLVISDMRMPQMDGASFLEQVRERQPGAMRVLLTGHSDIGATIAAVNRGEIYRYIAKPWDEEDVVGVVRQALELRSLAREKARLEALTCAQNAELTQLNAGLEELVAQRTAELQQTMESLEQAHKDLTKSFTMSIAVFANLIELRQGAAKGSSRRVAELARRMAQRLKVGEAELQDITVAALLRDIGKLALSDRIVKKAFEALGSEERMEFSKHTVHGQAALMALDELAEAARLIRSQNERFDGLGQPDGLRGTQIPLGARILAVAADYEGLQRGWVANVRYGASEAREIVVAGSGKRYDPAVLDALVEVIGPTARKPAPVEEERVHSGHLNSGMMLTRDLYTREGLLLLSANHILNQTVIERIRSYERSDGSRIAIYVRPVRPTRT